MEEPCTQRDLSVSVCAAPTRALLVGRALLLVHAQPTAPCPTLGNHGDPVHLVGRSINALN